VVAIAVAVAVVVVVVAVVVVVVVAVVVVVVVAIVVVVFEDDFGRCPVLAEEVLGEGRPRQVNCPAQLASEQAVGQQVARAGDRRPIVADMNHLGSMLRSLFSAIC
jgi:hypothetical protein